MGVGRATGLAARPAEAATLAGAEMQAVLNDLEPMQDADILWSAAEAALLPLLPFTMSIGDLSLSMFTVIAAFGTAQDVNSDELRIETMFPADAETEALFRVTAPSRA